MNEDFIEAVRKIVGLTRLSEYQRDALDDLYRETVAEERERCAQKAHACCASLDPAEVAEAIRSGK
jgi:hypothetical protein